MKVSCPQCHAVYEIDQSQIPDNGRSVQCSNCQKVWVVKPDEPLLLVGAQNQDAEAPAERVEPPQPPAPPRIEEPAEMVKGDVNFDTRLAALEALLVKTQTETQEVFITENPTRERPSSSYMNRDIHAEEMGLMDAELSVDPDAPSRTQNTQSDAARDEDFEVVPLVFEKKEKTPPSRATHIPPQSDDDDLGAPSQPAPKPANENSNEKSEAIVSQAVERLSSSIYVPKEPVGEKEVVKNLRQEHEFEINDAHKTRVDHGSPFEDDAPIQKSAPPKADAHQAEAADTAALLSVAEKARKARLAEQATDEERSAKPKTDPTARPNEEKRERLIQKAELAKAQSEKQDEIKPADDAAEKPAPEALKAQPIEEKPEPVAEKPTPAPVEAKTTEEVKPKPSEEVKAEPKPETPPRAEPVQKDVRTLAAKDHKMQPLARTDAHHQRQSKRKIFWSNFVTGFLFVVTVFVILIGLRYLSEPISNALPSTSRWMQNYNQIYDSSLSSFVEFVE